jgi:hypothetical protein
MSVDVIKGLLSYDQQSGNLYWTDKQRIALRGKVAGSIDAYGYLQLSVKGKRYKAHRVAWLLTYGSWPNGEIDHIDGDKLNNRIINLRDVSSQVNAWNRKLAQRNNSTGYRGVTKHRNKFMADIKVYGKKIYLGLFETPELAHQAYLQAKTKHHAVEAKLKEKNNG